MDKMRTTLLTLVKDGKILLSQKKRGFGAGILNGVGGKIEKGETPVQSLVREAKEEIGITVKNPQDMGMLVFDEIVKGKRQLVEMYLFYAEDYDGEIIESDEVGNSKWFDINEIPYDKMFEDDEYWLHLVLSGKRVKGTFVYDDDFKIVSANCEVIE